MSYRSILVNLDIDEPAAPLIRLATDLALRFEARLIGFSAADVPSPVVTADGTVFAGEAWQYQREDIERRLEELQAEFVGFAAGSTAVEWRGMVGDPTHWLATTARLADLVVTGAARGASTGSSYRSADLGGLLLRAGRPVLVAAGGAERMFLRKAVIAWKDTKEARRAVSDAVPLLSAIDEVVVVTVDHDPDDWIRAGVTDAAAFLVRHGIAARAEIITAKDENEQLAEFVALFQPDVIVSGAYGHSRLREWVFGGVTRTLLDEVRFHRLMSS